MKAILVIDINDDIKKYSVDVFKQNEDGDVMLEVATDLSLRPLPCKEPMRQMPSDVLEKGKRKRDFIIHKVDVDNSYAEGWNDCIDSITGETE